MHDGGPRSHVDHGQLVRRFPQEEIGEGLRERAVSLGCRNDDVAFGIGRRQEGIALDRVTLGRDGFLVEEWSDEI